MNRLVVVAAVLAAATITACASDTETVSEAVIERGGELYQTNCASCHGADLAGAADWKTPKDDGSYPPPPHDSSGHTWHHPDRVLIEIIRDGSDFPQSRMPSFGDQLTDEDSKRSSSSSRPAGDPKRRHTRTRSPNRISLSHETATAPNLRTKDPVVMVVTSHSVKER